MQRRKSGLTNLGTFLVRVQAVRQATPGVTGSSRARDRYKSVFCMRETYLHNAFGHFGDLTFPYKITLPKLLISRAAHAFCLSNKKHWCLEGNLAENHSLPVVDVRD